ncbi:MAG: gluconate 2-dehydrogenase subunit 3 family protein [Bacteroidota bacterium]|nr:gluconate 2-dehydrogenase subunit 3 family protein [Bacteroidota bacterium]
MDRRKSIKTLLIGTVSAGVLVEACTTEDKKKVLANDNAKISGLNRMKEEAEHEKEVNSKTFFTDHELATITLLGDIIIPKDEVSGSASDAKVPEFIEFIVKDMPQHQTPMRGGLRWLDMQCLTRFDKTFKDCSHEQQIEIVNDIAYPVIKDKNGKLLSKRTIKPGYEQGVSFFSLVRNLTATGFYTSAIGMKDVGYMGNTPNQWNGVPEDVLKQYGLAYTEKELKECISFDKK